MQTITDEQMQEMRGRAKVYCLLVLRPGPRMTEPGADKIIWEHGRRNFALRAEGLLSVVCPVGAPEVSGIGIFNAPKAEVDRLMQEDPAVQAGVLLYELYDCRGFPGDALPG